MAESAAILADFPHITAPQSTTTRKTLFSAE
jgi:hypothetical protein